MPPRTLDHGRYEIRELIGQGGMGEVYRAWDTRLHRDVAIKRLRAELTLDADALARFEREAHALARVNHPGVIQVYDLLSGEDGSRHLVLQFIHGESLDALVARRGGLGWDTCVRVGRGVCDALGAAHAAGIIHRDVKPSNVLLDAEGRPHVADFGVARLGDGSLSRTNLVIGTPGYIAPEAASGDPITPSVDLYSLAATLFEAYCGAPPYDAGDGPPSAALVKHVTAPVPDPRERRPDAPDAVRAFLMRGMAKSPRDRFASAADMGAALEATRTAPPAPPRPARTPPPTEVDRTSVMRRTPSPAPAAVATPHHGDGPAQQRRRRRAPWAAVAVVLLAAAVGGGYGLMQRAGDDADSSATRTRTGPSPAAAANPETTPATTAAAEPPPPAATVTVTTERVTTAPAPDPPPQPPPAAPPEPAPSEPAPTLDEAHRLVDDGWRAFQAGDSQTALELSQRALLALRGSGDPYEANANYNIGVSLMALGDCGSALPYLRVAADHPSGTNQQHRKRDNAVRDAEKCA